ncbi:DNA mismatch repair protein mutS [Cesiribacter andamanensis AMV16]|uniref:DNA mismatch repair protein MutS n=1 Tax=Cesiribacter andamanensis AMV16 TaxID=1279009 RepID=M7N987_9BACT|nr:DNA mismatch repair protein mutS [Cesiribacter andamanensis AMV16]
MAICDQLEDPKMVKGIVKRGVTELVTPGLSFNDQVLERSRNNYLCSLHFGKSSIGISFLDVSTGEFMVAEGPLDYAEKLLQGLQPSEVIYSKGSRKAFAEHFSTYSFSTYTPEDWVFQWEYGYECLTKHFGTSSLKGFGVEDLPEGIVAAGAILHYLQETEHHDMKHIAQLSRIAEEHYVWLDPFTIRNLELVYPQQPDGIPLISVLDQTCTPMGARQLRRWLVMPLKDLPAIQERLSVVEALGQQSDLLQQLAQRLRQIGDVERLISKVAVGRINPREMLQLKRALKHTQPIRELLADTSIDPLRKLADQLNPCSYLLERIERELADEVPLVINQGGMMRDGIHEKLDELRSISFSGKDYLLQIQQRETARTGISSLKVAYNKVFGYYLEVTNAHKNKVPQDWIRKQTLVNAERYITEELKTYEEKILNAEGEINSIEQQLFLDLVAAAAEYTAQIQQNARVLATIDCLAGFALVAKKRGYVKPEVNEGFAIDIEQGRHPVIEQQLPADQPYIPNDTLLDPDEQQIMIITGPNMAGKSALLRQTALIVLMAQVGSFVPARRAAIGLVDRVFTRVGASDNLSRGESTFMVEMIETASILNNLSNRSLVLMDEIGRGTSTYDGISIAWSIVEYLHGNDKHRPKTLFATHYHELNQLAEDLPRVRNYNVSVKEVGDKVIFMRKLQPGGSQHSFGIHVAQMAGMPNRVVIRASEIMHHLEGDKSRLQHQQKVKEVPKNTYQLSLFELDPKFEQVRQLIEKTDINVISPVEALLKLNEIKGLLENGKKG